MRRLRSLLRLRWVLVASAYVLGSAGLILGARVLIERNASHVHASAADVPQHRVALVLGCVPVLASGQPNLFFHHRMQAAADLFKAGRVDYLLVSGDNHRAGYDEPTAMRDALVARGVPADRIALDYAGFSTLDSVVRARHVFGQSELCIVSQRDHAMRAVFIARAHGMSAVGFAARDVGFRFGFRTHVRESLARVRAVLDVKLLGREPRFYGPPVTIGAEDPAAPSEIPSHLKSA